MKKLLCILLAIMMMLSAASVFAEAAPAKQALFTPGTYQGEAQGMLSTVKVWITVDEQEIIAVLCNIVSRKSVIIRSRSFMFIICKLYGPGFHKHPVYAGRLKLLHDSFGHYVPSFEHNVSVFVIYITKDS